MTDSSVDAARERLVRFKGRYPEFCERTGLDYSWVSKFAQGVRGKRPSLDQFNKLLLALDQIEAQEASPTNTTEDPAPPPRRTTAAKGETAETAATATALTRQTINTH